MGGRLGMLDSERLRKSFIDQRFLSGNETSCRLVLTLRSYLLRWFRILQR